MSVAMSPSMPSAGQLQVLQSEIRRVARKALRRWKGQRVGPQDEDDLVQEVLLRMNKPGAGMLDRWDPGRGSLATYARMIAHSKIVDIERIELRRKVLLGPVDSLDASPSVAAGGPSPEAMTIVRDETLRLLRCAYQQMAKPQDRQLFQLLVVEEATVAEASKQTGLPRQSVYRWRAKLKKKLRDCADCDAGDRGARSHMSVCGLHSVQRRAAPAYSAARREAALPRSAAWSAQS